MRNFLTVYVRHAPKNYIRNFLRGQKIEPRKQNHESRTTKSRTTKARKKRKARKLKYFRVFPNFRAIRGSAFRAIRGSAFAGVNNEQ